MSVKKRPSHRHARIFWAFLCAGMILSGCSDKPDPMQQKKAELDAIIQKNIGQLETKERRVAKLRQPFQKSIDFFHEVKALHKEHCGEEFDDAFIDDFTATQVITIDSIKILVERTHRKFLTDAQAISRLTELNKDIVSSYNSLKAEENVIPQYFGKLRAHQRLLENMFKQCYAELSPQQRQEIRTALDTINQRYEGSDSVYIPLVM